MLKRTNRPWLLSLLLAVVLPGAAAAAGSSVLPQFVVDFEDGTKIVGALAPDGAGTVEVAQASYWDLTEWHPLSLCAGPGTICLAPTLVDENTLVIVGIIDQGEPGQMPPNADNPLGLEDFFSLLPKGIDEHYWSIKTALVGEVIASMMVGWHVVSPPDPIYGIGKQPPGPIIGSPDSEALRVAIRLTEKEILVVIVHPNGGLEMFVLSKTLEGFWIWETLPDGPDPDWPGPNAAFPWRETVPPDGG